VTSTMVCIDTLAMPAEECRKDLRIFTANAQIRQPCRIEASEKKRELQLAYAVSHEIVPATVKLSHGAGLREAIRLRMSPFLGAESSKRQPETWLKCDVLHEPRRHL
jgi:excinuclease UvrABC helicase subunit UvrB